MIIKVTHIIENVFYKQRDKCAFKKHKLSAFPLIYICIVLLSVLLYNLQAP